MKKILILIVLGLFLVGCTNDNTIDIGSILILTGEGASWGEASRNGIDMAISELNTNGGALKNFRAIHEDDQSDAKKAVLAFQKLTDADNVDIIIGTTWSHTGVPLIEMADQKQVLMMSPSLGVKEFNEGSDYLFNTWPHDYILSAQLADYVMERGHKKIVLIGAQQIWVKDQTNSFTQRFEELGGEIVAMVEPDPQQQNVNTEALILSQAKEVTAIVSTTDGVLVGTRVAKRLRELGVTLPIFSITIDAQTIKASEGSYEGMEFMTFLTPSEKFRNKYVSQFGKEPEIGAASAYDAVMMVAQAIEATGSEDPTILQQYMNSIETFDGQSGFLKSDGKGGFLKELAVKKVVDGKAVNFN